MTDADECTCELLDVSTVTKVMYIRGLSRGCPIHTATDYELRVIAAEEAQRRRHEEARKRAREAP